MELLKKSVSIKTINEIQNEIIRSFKILEEDRESMLTYIMELGTTIPPLDEKYKIDQYLLKGCMSKVWLVYQKKAELLIFQADSNTIITKGLISLLIHIFSGRSPQDIVKAHPYFIDAIGMNQLFGFQRINGIFQMLKQLKLIAMSYLSDKTTTLHLSNHFSK